ncbi:MAG: 2Fe-2S iron-sulfur cluster-binding protein, partial [Caldimonas sp.]
MNAPLAPARLQAARVEITLDGRRVGAIQGETILDAATREGVAIPTLCFKPGYRPDGNCRACVVE